MTAMVFKNREKYGVLGEGVVCVTLGLTVIKFLLLFSFIHRYFRYSIARIDVS